MNNSRNKPMSARQQRKIYNKRLKTLNDTGRVKIDGVLIIAANYLLAKHAELDLKAQFRIAAGDEEEKIKVLELFNKYDIKITENKFTK
jgi:hypothetical protein